MPNFLLVIASIVLVQLSWGTYGPLIRTGTAGLGGNHLLPFVFVGVAYFLIAVIVPVALLVTRGEKGHWTTKGVLWSTAAGIVTAVGALGVILAFTNGGSPIFVMPLVFGGAPVVNTFYTMFISKSYREANPIFFAGLILVIAGAATVLLFNPAAKKPSTAAQDVPPAATAQADTSAEPPAAAHAEHGETNIVLVLAFVALTVVCWGVYGPVLHNGQVQMEGSRLRPFLCVGMAYFFVAVLAPLAMLYAQSHPMELTFGGTAWSLAGGAAGALGSLGVILAFNFGGKPVYVMPLIFGGAPVVNTLVSVATASNIGSISPLFYAGLIIVVAGSATVLIFAPKAHPVPQKA